MTSRPGTVSKILWHFTGGPRWDALARKQEPEPKPAKEAYDALMSIVESEEIRIGGYRECVVAEIKRYDTDKDTRTKTAKIERVVLETDSIVCVADIPLMHLAYHAQRYGRFAIGFGRNRMIGAGFNPVLYTLENRFLSASLHAAVSSIQALAKDLDDTRDELSDFASDVESAVDGLEDSQGNSIDNRIDFDPTYVEWKIDDAETHQKASIDNMKTSLAFVKTFTQNEFDTIYCEREWRSTRPFRFKPSDIAMIVLPRALDGFRYLDDFIESSVASKIPRRVPIIAWEDVVEQ